MLALIALATCQTPPAPDNPEWTPWPHDGRGTACSDATLVASDPADLRDLAAAPHGALLLAGSWSSYTRSSLAVLDEAGPAMIASGVPVWCLEVDDPRLPGWPDVAAGFDLTDGSIEPMCSLYAKGTSSPLLLIRDGVLVGCVQSPWAFSPDELATAVTSALGGDGRR